MTTAFQPNAFQNNAFQIDSEPPSPSGGGGGGMLGKPKRPYRHYTGEEERIRLATRKRAHIPVDKQTRELRKLYADSIKHAKTAKEKKRIVSVIDPFLYPSTPEEEANRRSARYIVDEPPSVQRLDFDSIARNKFSFDLMSKSLEDVRSSQKRESLRMRLLVRAAHRQAEQNDEAMLLMLMMEY